MPHTHALATVLLRPDIVVDPVVVVVVVRLAWTVAAPHRRSRACRVRGHSRGAALAGRVQGTGATVPRAGRRVSGPTGATHHRLLATIAWQGLGGGGWRRGARQAACRALDRSAEDLSMGFGARAAAGRGPGGSPRTYHRQLPQRNLAPPLVVHSSVTTTRSPLNLPLRTAAWPSLLSCWRPTPSGAAQCRCRID